MNEYESRWHHDRMLDEGVRKGLPWVLALLLTIGLVSAVLTWGELIPSAVFLGVIVFVCAFVKPEWALLVLTILAPLQWYLVDHGMSTLIPGTGLTPLNLVALLLIIGALAQQFSTTKPAAESSAIDKPLMLYLAWSALAVVVGILQWGVDPEGIGEWLAMACGFGLYWAVRRRWRSDRLAIAAVWVALGMVLVEAFWVLWQYTHIGVGGAYSENLKYQIVGSFPPGNSNDIGTYLSVYCMVALGLFLAMRWSIWRWPALAIFVIAGGATFFTYSRASYIALLAGALAVVLFKHKRYLLPAIGVIVLLPSILPASVMERANMTGDASGENRKEFWKNGISLMLTHPLGVGWRGYSKNEAARGQKIRDPHSMYVLVAAEQGVVGIVLFVGLLLAVGTETIRAIGRAKTPFAQGLGVGLFGALVAYCVNNAFGSRMIWFYNVQHFWLLLGILVVLTRRQAEKVAVVEEVAVPREPKPVSPWRYRRYV